MDNHLIIGAFVVIVILFIIVNSNASKKRKIFKNNVYSYTAKDLLMTRTEAEFFVKLNNAVQERYYVFPQVHLSALLNHKVKGQEWVYAFKHINGKSVDYVLCDKQTLRPFYAIELDDLTHEKRDRQKRDNEVERIFEEAQLPLVRFNNKDISEEQIIQALVKANSL